MIRSIRSTVALATLLAAATPVLADPGRTQGLDQGVASAPVPEHAAAPDGEAVARPAPGKDTSPIGFGWG